MKQQVATVYQSGERVRMAGTYEVIGVIQSAREKEEDRRERSRRMLAVGEFFPNYLGRAVGWHLLTSDPKAGYSLSGTEKRI